MRKNILHKLLFILIAFILSSTIKLKAQNDIGLYGMRPVIQSNMLNPAFIPESKIHFGIPAISSVYGGFVTDGAKYNQIFTKNESDSLVLNPSSILENIESSNYIKTQLINQWINFGIKWKRFYFSASISDVYDATSIYSKTMIDVAANGNADYVGETIDFSPLAIKSLHYREYALGVSMNINDKWNAGLRAKMLFGKSAINSEEFDLKLLTTEDYYYLNANSNVLVNASLKDDSADIAMTDYLFSGSNMGFGIDIGASYNANEKWSFSASALDLGFIKYDRWSKNYTSKADIVFKGFDATDYLSVEETNQLQWWEDTKDSLVDILEIEETEDAFDVYLTAKVYLGANYKISEKQNIGALVRMDIFKGEIIPTISASYYHQLTKNIGVSASYSASNRNYTNVGLGVVANFKPVQIYVVTDNVYGVIAPDNVKSTNIRLGVNIFFPESEKVKEEEKVKTEEAKTE